MMTLSAQILTTLALIFAGGFLQTQTPPQPAPAVIPLVETVVTRPTAGFAGDWSGQLQSQSGTHSAHFNIRVSSDDRALIISYSATDEPHGDASPKTGTPPTTHLMLTLFPQAAIATLSADGQHQSTSYSMAGYDGLAKTQLGTLLLTSPDSRLTLTLTANQLTWIYETRAPGSNDAFTTQKTYTLNRTAPPV